MQPAVPARVQSAAASGLQSETSSANARGEPLPAVVVNSALDDTIPRARIAGTLELGFESPRRRRARTAAIVSAFVVVAAALGGASWLLLFGTASSGSAETAIQPAPAAPPALERTSAAPPEVPTAAVVERAVEAPSVNDHGVVEPSGSPAVPLVAIDGSEATAPACDALLASVPKETDVAWSHEHLVAGRKALVRGDVEGSQRAFCQSIRARTVDLTVALELAQLLLLRRDGTAAAHWAMEAARLEPNSPRVLALLGDAIVRTGDVEGARTAWLNAAKLEPNDGAGIDRMLRSTLEAAERSLKERDPARAERLLRRVVAFRADDSTAHERMASALAKLGFSDSADRWARRAAELGEAGSVLEL